MCLSNNGVIWRIETHGYQMRINFMLRKNQILYMYMIINGGIITAKRETTAGRKHIITPDSV